MPPTKRLTIQVDLTRFPAVLEAVDAEVATGLFRDRSAVLLAALQTFLRRPGAAGNPVVARTDSSVTQTVHVDPLQTSAHPPLSGSRASRGKR